MADSDSSSHPGSQSGSQSASGTGSRTGSSQRSAKRVPAPIWIAALMTVPGGYLGFATYFGLPVFDLPAAALAVIYGVAIVGGALLLSWAAEAIQVDINAGLALALLALLAVLPEYAVDFVFTLKCGNAFESGGGTPDVCNLALANMTGANRVLVGVGWPLVVLVATLAVWKARRNDSERTESGTTHAGKVELPRVMSVELVFLGMATIYSLTLPLKSTLTLWDAGIFFAIFAAYAWRLSKIPPEEPDLIGTSAWVGGHDRRARRWWLVAMFVVAALAILLTAEHFAESLTETGTQLGISEFLLVQWVAPLASESPELLVASIYAWRLKAGDSLGALLSSKVNQWTLLVGGLPLIFALTAGTLHGLPLDVHQRYELLITAAQSLFAVAILLDRSLSFRGALALLALFLVQFFVSVFGTDTANRWTIVVLSIVYGVLALGRFARRWRTTKELVLDGTVRPFEKMEDESQQA